MGMTAIELIVHSREGEERHPLPLGDAAARCSWRQRCLPGASAIHVVLADGDGVRLRAEIPAEGGESVSVDLELDDEGHPSLWSPGRHVLTLPPDERFAPVAPIVPAGKKRLDLALIVDGTSRRFVLEETEEVRRVTSRLLLDDPEQWPAEVEKLTALASAVCGAFSDVRVTVFAFGDHPLAHAAADDLQPRYSLHPADEDSRALRPRTQEQLRSALLAIPATSGGDFVDAGAGALAACASLRWRREARKLAVIFGDSPGHSILHPVPPGGDAGVRDLDVDTQAMRLQKRGVEVATIYHAPPTDVGLEDLAARAQLLNHARRQYRRLASLPQLAFEASSFDPAAAAERILDVDGPIARGPALGELVEIRSAEDEESDGSDSAAERADGKG